MSNPVSLYVGETQNVLDEIRNIDWDSDNPTPKLRDYLADNGSDMFTYELAEMFGRIRAPLVPAHENFIRLILWSWLGGTSIYYIPNEKTEDIGFDLAIPPESIGQLATMIRELDVASMSQSLFSENEIWETAMELEEYLKCWVSAFTDALDKRQGLFYKVWV